MKLPLFIFTINYPYGGETSFLQNEVKFLADYFSPVILVPRNVVGVMASLPKGIVVDHSYSFFMGQNRSRASRFSKAIHFPYLMRELASNATYLVHKSNFRRMLQSLTDASLTQEWVENSLTQHPEYHTSVFYTYWLGKYTLGIGAAKKRFPHIHLISRAHRIDLYPRRLDNLYMPCQGLAIKVSDKVFTVSNHGQCYLQYRYPWADNIEISRLGVMGSETMTPYSQDNVFRIASCSGLRPVKRVDLLARGIRKAAESRSAQTIHWDHFGEGETRQEVENEIHKFPGNVRAKLWGQVSNDTLLEYYSNNPVDIFINTSSSEGLPVSIMEALSFGIPVIATDVGGTPEIVTKDCGWLISENPSEEEIAAQIIEALESRNELSEMKNSCKRKWEEEYDAIKNFDSFTRSIANLL